MREHANLTNESARILRAVIEAIRPRGHGFDHAIDDDVLTEIDATLPFLPAPLRLAFPIGLRVLEWGPLPFTGRAARLSTLERGEARRYCEGWLHSRIPIRRSLLLGLRALVVLAFYQHPDVLRSMGVRWDQRMEATMRLRAEALRDAAREQPAR